MNALNFDLVKIPSTQTWDCDGISFSSIYYVRIYIDGIDLLEKDQSFKGSFLVWDELLKSSMYPGKYLLFTSINGIADDGGWDYVKVLHINNKIEWDIPRDDRDIKYYFDIQQYLNEIKILQEKINKIEIGYKLEPAYVLFPQLG